MNNTTFLYFCTLFSWSFTWLAIQYQLGIVPPTWSVAYRFGAAGLLLLGYCLIKGYTLSFSKRHHATMFLQGLFLFSINFLLFYLGSQYLISGIAAVIFATITAMNIINARLFFKTPITLKLVCGTLLGISGLIAVFWSEVQLLLNDAMGLKATIIGMVYCILATVLASLGNMMSKYNHKQNIPLIQNNAWSMMYGAIVTSVVALVCGQPLVFDVSFSYVSSLFYLTVVGTIIGFGCYLKLLGRIGPEKVGYVFVIVPIMAMIISTFVEDFHWQTGTFIGVTLIVLGNYLVLAQKLLFIKKNIIIPIS